MLAVSTLETGDAVLEATVLFEYNPHKQIEHQHFRSDHEDYKVQAQPWVFCCVSAAGQTLSRRYHRTKLQASLRMLR